MGQSDYSPRAQSRKDRRIQDLGNTFVIKETGETFKALSRFLAQTDMPPYAPEDGENPEEVNPLELYAVARDSGLQNGHNVHFFDAADPKADNYLVETVDRKALGGVTVRVYALLYRAPIAQ